MKVQSDHVANGPHGLHWNKPGAIVDVEDVALAEELLALQGFSRPDETANALPIEEPKETPAPRRAR